MPTTLVGCLFQLDERERNIPILLQRMKEIKDQMNRASGVLKSITKEKFQRQPDYWLATMQGWANKLRVLGCELTIVQTELARHIIQ